MGGGGARQRPPSPRGDGAGLSLHLSGSPPSFHLLSAPQCRSSRARVRERRDARERATEVSVHGPDAALLPTQSASFQGDRGGSGKTKGKAALGVSSMRPE